MTTLNVFHEANRVGSYTKDPSGRIEFQYDSSWLDNENFPISLTMPLQKQPYSGTIVDTFFSNLLPDDPATREKIAEVMHTEGTDSHSLLQELGYDCVGAFQFLPEGDKPKDPGIIEAEPLTDEDIVTTLNNLEYIPLGVEREQPFRISLAGQQAKTAFLRWDNEWLRPLKSTPTSHIFKPQINNPYLHHTAENEWFCMEFARRLSLPIPDLTLKTFGDQTVLIVKRFDRIIDESNQSIHRIHQEDFCQILGRPHTKKYEQTEEDERLVEQCLNKLRTSNRIRDDQALFIKGQIVQWLLGAGDGHLKNYSFFLSGPNQYRLTPFYDIMSNEPYDQDNPKAILQVHEGLRKSYPADLAFGLGPQGHTTPDNIHPEDFRALEAHTLLTKDEIDQILQGIHQTLDKTVHQLKHEVNDTVPDSILEPILHGIIQRRQVLEKEYGPAGDQTPGTNG